MLATASIASAVLFVGYRDNLPLCVYFIIPAIMITKLYAITIIATFNNRPLAIGGPPPLPDLENCYDVNPIHKTCSRTLGMTGEIQIGRTVVKQVWKDDVPLSHLQVGGHLSSVILSSLIITLVDVRRRLPVHQRGRQRIVHHAKGL
jgi:hypothetical protein